MPPGGLFHLAGHELDIVIMPYNRDYKEQIDNSMKHGMDLLMSIDRPCKAGAHTARAVPVGEVDSWRPRPMKFYVRP